MVSLYGFLLWLDILCPGLHVNEIHAPYDRHHKVSTSLKPHLNGSVYITSYGIRQIRWNNNNCAQYKVLKSRLFLSFIYNTFTFYNTPTSYITKKEQTNNQKEIQEGVFALTGTLRRVKVVSCLYYRPK